ncbi:hypothetical protein DKX38_028642 [Salix brachista]|uniref:Uncharacterized protein n=1 Tax=Salix brachista TaxID=2182728 RepID=A0A5N5J7U3_9ROSI|nr:hypothetical protein DKX38_028642 [Salix brachista]
MSCQISFDPTKSTDHYKAVRFSHNLLALQSWMSFLLILESGSGAGSCYPSIGSPPPPAAADMDSCIGHDIY